MNRIAKGFDLLSPVYDFLAFLMFGNNIRKAQVYFLEMIPPGAKVMVLGGGTGWIIEQIHRAQTVSAIWYVDISAGMLRHTRKRVKNDPRVHLIQGTVEMLTEKDFDVIIMPFFLDLFPSDRLPTIISRTQAVAKSDACWWVCDFVQERQWHGILLWAMYRFFAVTCRLETCSLPDWMAILRNKGLSPILQKHFYHGFIRTAVFSKVLE